MRLVVHAIQTATGKESQSRMASAAQYVMMLWMLVWCAGCATPVTPLLMPTTPAAPTKVVYVIAYGYHLGIVVKRDDIKTSLWPEHDDFPEATYLEAGWGDRDFYLAPEATSGLALKAAFASTASVLYIVGLRGPPTAYVSDDRIVAIALTEEGFDALCAFIHASYRKDTTGRASAIEVTAGGRFYLAEGRYGLHNTCNTWTANALRAAGVPITPAGTASRVMRQVRQISKGSLEPQP